MPEHRKSRLMAHTDCRYDLVMPDEYFKNTIRPQLCSLFGEDALKDTTINLRLWHVTSISLDSSSRLILDRRTSSVNLNSLILSLLSPVLCKMVCGNFRESICKEINLDDVVAERLLKLLQLACGAQGIVAVNVMEMLELGELADRLQMEAVRSEIEDRLLKDLNQENCLEMIQRSEARGLHRLQKDCYNMLRDKFGVLSPKEGFSNVSEETLAALLEEDELGVRREEDVFDAVVRWTSNNSDEGMRGGGLLRKIRYGVMSNEYLAGLMSSALLPGHGLVKEFVNEAMAKMGVACGEEIWDGVGRLCDKWMVARGMKGRIIGVDVLECPTYVAIDGQGRIVVSDSVLHEIIIFNHDGSVARRFGSEGTAPGRFEQPMGVAVDRHGHIVVADQGNHRIQVVNADGSVERCIGSKGAAVGLLKHPCGVAIDQEGHIVVADCWNHRIQVFDTDGTVVRHFESHGAAIGQLDHPTGVAVDGAGRIAVADCHNHRVQAFNGDGSVALCFGSYGDGPGQLKYPCGVAVDSAGRFVVSDTGNHRVQVFNPDGIWERVIGLKGDAVGGLNRPYGVVVDGAGRINGADRGNHRVQVL